MGWITVIPVGVAASIIIAVVVNLPKLLGWLRRRRASVRVEIGFRQRPADPDGQGGQRLAHVIVTNMGARDVVLKEFGIVRAAERSWPRRPETGNARAITFARGERLAHEDYRNETFVLDHLPPHDDKQKLWGYARTSPRGDLFLSDEPLSVIDQRPGSATAGRRIFP